jgi:hypothetical protein
VCIAQFLEYGGSVGAVTYSGDLQRGYNLKNPSIGISPLFRFNFSEIVTLRLSVLAGNVKGQEKPIDALAIERQQSFESGLLELSGVFEYHFLDFKTENSRFNYSPYVFAGFGILNFPDAPSNENVGALQPVLPLGGGFKYLYNKKYSIGIEFGARKTFFDYLDGIADGDQFIKDYQYGNPNDDDWYFFTAVSFSVILYDIPCPYPYTPNKSILSR